MISSPKLSMRKRGFWRLSSLLILICILAVVLIPHVQALDNLVWDKDLILNLPTRNTNVTFSQTIYFTSLTWNDLNDSFTFTDLYTTGTAIATFGANLSQGNLTLLNAQDTRLDFNLTDPTTSDFTLPSKPNQVLLNGADNPEGLNWTWTASILTLTLITTASSFVSFTFPASAITSNLPLILAAFAVMMAVVAISYVIVHRKPDDSED